MVFRCEDTSRQGQCSSQIRERRKDFIDQSWSWWILFLSEKESPRLDKSVRNIILGGFWVHISHKCHPSLFLVRSNPFGADSAAGTQLSLKLLKQKPSTLRWLQYACIIITYSTTACWIYRSAFLSVTAQPSSDQQQKNPIETSFIEASLQYSKAAWFMWQWVWNG